MKSIKTVLVLVILLIIPFHTAYAKWSYQFVVYNKNVYVITDKKVNAELIGSKIGRVTTYSTHEGTYWGNFSNTYPTGTKFYEIIGSDVNKVIAIKKENGDFIEAQYEHEYLGCRYDIDAILLYSIGFIISIILIRLLIKRKIHKSQ